MRNKKIDLTKKELISCYKEMLLLRRFEEKAGQLYGMGLIGGFCHLYIGQEAVAVGIVKAVNLQDTIITSYRDHGFMLARGSCPKGVMSELLGKFTGCSKGKGGSMHMFDLEKNFYGGHGIVGAQVSLGTGLGLAHKYKANNCISVTIYGDGACNQGQVYESFNMAKLWNLPILYIIENNEYAMGTSVERSSSIKDLYKKGESFGIKGKQVNGMDFFEVYNAVKEVSNLIRKNQEPYLLELKTYRYRGHSMSDPAQYRDKNEVEEYKKKYDPIIILKDYIIEQYQDALGDLQIVSDIVKEIVKESVDYAQDSDEPNLKELYKDVYK